jgi:hypothetical protein
MDQFNDLTSMPKEGTYPEIISLFPIHLTVPISHLDTLRLDIRRDIEKVRVLDTVWLVGHILQKTVCTGSTVLFTGHERLDLCFLDKGSVVHVPSCFALFVDLISGTTCSYGVS